MVPGPRCHIYSESWILQKQIKEQYFADFSYEDEVLPDKDSLPPKLQPPKNIPSTSFNPCSGTSGNDCWTMLDPKTSHVKTLPNSLEENHSSIFGAPIQQAPGDARVNPRRAGPGVHPPTRRQPGTEASPHAAPCQEPCVWWAGALDPQHLRWMAGWLDGWTTLKIMQNHEAAPT